MVRCNMCMEVYLDLDLIDCPECKTDLYLMDVTNVTLSKLVNY
jgi:uncharacterized protein YbaR (Trm112 family)